MSQTVTCPCGCNYTFEIDSGFEKYEKMAVQMINGSIAPKQTCGYDAIDGLGIKYQVKHSIINRKDKRWHWSFRFRINGDWPDYFILYGINKKDIFCFLLSTRKFYEMAYKTKDFGTWLLSASSSWQSSIWDYQVTPETFESKLNWLINIGEFTMFLDEQNSSVRVRG